MEFDFKVLRGRLLKTISIYIYRERERQGDVSELQGVNWSTLGSPIRKHYDSYYNGLRYHAAV
jgi:hypothetical protein